MEPLNYINSDDLIIIPVVIVIGGILKKASFLNDKYIPLCLAFISVIICMLMDGIKIQSFIQGILIAGVAVGLHQGVKQLGVDNAPVNTTEASN